MDLRNRIAFYCCCDAPYIGKAVIALLSIKRYNNKCGYYLFTNMNDLSQNQIDEIKTTGISVEHLNLSDEYDVCWGKWKPICFWIFRGPEKLYELGFDYSCSVDGDVFCLNELCLDWISDVDFYAGVENLPRYESGNCFLKKYQHPLIKCGLDIDLVKMTEPNINTGVVFWNNACCKENSFYERITAVYRTIKKLNLSNIGFGDQTLLATFSSQKGANDNIYLDDRWNFRFHKGYGNRTLLCEDNPDVYLCHFIGVKPWRQIAEIAAWKNTTDFRIKMSLEWKTFAARSMKDLRSLKFDGYE